MFTVFLSVIVGVVTGVAANLVTYIFVNIWLPSYRNYVYKGHSVAGDWTIAQNDLMTDGERLAVVWVLSATLEQRAYEISGNATATRIKNGGATDVINYEVRGQIFDRFISLTFKNRDATRIAYSIFLIEVKGDGASMKGYRSFYGLRKSRIRSVECTWRRGGYEISDCHNNINTDAA
jgi:hypothetical protein